MLLMIGCLSGCISLSPKRNDLFFESFYEKTRLIMREEEKEIYRSLPDTASRKEFIERFWKIRDPDPTTEEIFFEFFELMSCTGMNHLS